MLPSLKRYFVEMRFKPMPRYESGVVLLPEREHRDGFLARLLERSGHSALGRMLGLMSEKRESLLGRLVHGRDREPSHRWAACSSSRACVQATAPSCASTM